jgi:hypothetical protein
MKAKHILSVLLAALALAGMPGASSAGWSSALTSGCRAVYAPEGAPAEAPTREAGEASSDSVFKLTCHRCGRCGYRGCYPAYSRCYPGYSYYPSYGYRYYPSYYPSYSYYPRVSCYYGW